MTFSLQKEESVNMNKHDFKLTQRAHLLIEGGLLLCQFIIMILILEMRSNPTGPINYSDVRVLQCCSSNTKA